MNNWEFAEDDKIVVNLSSFNSLGSLCKEHFSSERTAFIGTCGNGDKTLYLVNYDTISSASHPQMTWNDTRTFLKIERFVNVRVIVYEDPNLNK